MYLGPKLSQAAQRAVDLVMDSDFLHILRSPLNVPTVLRRRFSSSAQWDNAKSASTSANAMVVAVEHCNKALGGVPTNA